MTNHSAMPVIDEAVLDAVTVTTVTGTDSVTISFNVEGMKDNYIPRITNLINAMQATTVQLSNVLGVAIHIQDYIADDNDEDGHNPIPA